MSYGRKLWTVLIGCALLGALAFPASAPAARGLVTGLTGPGQYQSGNPATGALWFDRTVEAGAGIVRLPIEWRSVAPQRPVNPTNPDSYNFAALDRGVRDAAARGVQVLITVNSSPRWAEGPGRPASLPETASWKPNPSDLAQFMQAVAARYSGSFDPDGGGGQPRLPAVQGVQVLNEPNQDAWLAPQFDGATIIGPDQYRVLLNASYNAIKAVNPGMLVVTGGTSPYGDPPGGPYPPGGARVRPVQWWEKFLCVRATKSKKKGKKKGKKSKKVRYVRTGCPGKPVFDVFAHQAIDNTGKGPLQSGPTKDDVSTPDMGRLVPLLRAAERLGTVSGGRHQVWVTEFWWDSRPPNPVGAPLVTQARWIEQTLYLYWKAGANVAINFTIQDSTLFPVTRNGFQSGLYFLDGSPKPALTAFRFPFVTERINKRTLRAWGKSPEAGKLRIQRKRGKRWATVKKLNVGKGGVFVTKLRLRGKQKLRAVVGGTTSITWKQGAFAKPSSGGGGSSGTPILLPLIAGLALVVLAAAALRRRQSARRRGGRFRPARRGRLGSSTAI
jgi:MYXO-CTERM domain-containing protein